MGPQPQREPRSGRHGTIRDEHARHLRRRRHQLVSRQAEADPVRLSRDRARGPKGPPLRLSGQKAAVPVHHFLDKPAEEARRDRVEAAATGGAGWLSIVSAGLGLRLSGRRKAWTDAARWRRPPARRPPPSSQDETRSLRYASALNRPRPRRTRGDDARPERPRRLGSNLIFAEPGQLWDKPRRAATRVRFRFLMV